MAVFRSIVVVVALVLLTGCRHDTPQSSETVTPPPAQKPSPRADRECGKKIVDDSYDNGRVDGKYPVRCFRVALEMLPSRGPGDGGPSADDSIRRAYANAFGEKKRVTVPNLVGLPQPDAQAKLESLGIRWRFGGSARILSRAPKPLPPSVSVSPDPHDDLVVSQAPTADREVEPRDVVVLETECTLLRFQNAGCR